MTAENVYLICIYDNMTNKNNEFNVMEDKSKDRKWIYTKNITTPTVTGETTNTRRVIPESQF